MRADDRLTLAAITTTAVLAAFLAAHFIAFIPAHIGPPAVLTWSATYTAVVLGLARRAGLPPARTLCAATLVIAAGLRLALIGLGHAVDGALLVLGKVSDAGLSLLNPPTLEGA